MFVIAKDYGPITWGEAGQGSNKLFKGEGDCDTDDDCAYDLKCFQRENHGPNIPGVIVPRDLPHNHDYCYDPRDRVLARNLGADPAVLL